MSTLQALSVDNSHRKDKRMSAFFSLFLEILLLKSAIIRKMTRLNEDRTNPLTSYKRLHKLGKNKNKTQNQIQDS